jgi:urease accessory protein
MGKLLTQGRIYLQLEDCAGVTKIADLLEAGGLRLKFPNSAGCEAVLINTAGGVVGGDILNLGLSLGRGAKLAFTTASAERIYRSLGESARINVHLKLGGAAALEWLPQENILFSGAALERRLEVEMEASSQLTLCETIVFGRTAMGERLTSGFLNDQWRIRRAGKLLFCETLRLSGDIHELLSRKAIGDAARSVTSFVYIAPDAEARYQRTSENFNRAPCEAGVSAFRGMLVARAVSPDAARLKAFFTSFLQEFRGRELPRAFLA